MCSSLPYPQIGARRQGVSEVAHCELIANAASSLIPAFAVACGCARGGPHGRSAADVMCVERGLNLKRPWMLAMT